MLAKVGSCVLLTVKDSDKDIDSVDNFVLVDALEEVDYILQTTP